MHKNGKRYSDLFTESNCLKVDFLINFILSNRILVEHRFKKSKDKQKILSVARELSEMCFILIDRDVDEISKINSIGSVHTG